MCVLCCIVIFLRAIIIIIIIKMADRCCKCQKTGVCKSCSCVSEGKFCTNCYPARHNRCCNLPPASNSVLSSSSEDLDTNVDVSHCDSDYDCGSVLSPTRSPHRSASCASTTVNPASDELPLDQQELDSLLIEAYGPDGLCTTSHSWNSDWRSRWLSSQVPTILYPGAQAADMYPF